jgi:spermidine synthase
MNDQHHNPFISSRFLLFLTVIVSGGAVMIIELLGTRIIAPFYGVSIFVWSSLISVTMIALALGYYLGGYLADRYAAIRLQHILLIASLCTAFIPLISAPVMVWTNPLGLRGGAFCSALLLFTPPLTALAMVGPFAIKNATENLQRLGSTVGLIYAVSTLGSVVATLALGFYLLPAFGVRAIVYAASIVLLLLAGVLFVLDKRGPLNSISNAFLLLVCLSTFTMLAVGYAKPAQSAKDWTVVHEEESHYGWVRVVDNSKYNIRLLLSDSSVLSAMALSNGQTLLGYQNIIGLLPMLRPGGSRALLIGLGGGHVARVLKYQGMETDTIEIDPEVADAALKYFNFTPTGAFIVGDGRFEIQKLPSQYDLIIHDCFTGGSEPIHMLTVEMLQQLRGKLTERGLLALNYVGFTQGEGTKAVASVYKTLKSVLPNVRVFITDKAEFTDFIFVASEQPVELNQSSQDQRIQWLLDHQIALSDAEGILISDDYNPMESLQTRKSEEYRKVFMERVTPELLFR